MPPRPAADPLAPRRLTRRGMALFLVLCLVAVASIGVFMLHRHMLSRIHQEEQTVLHAIGANLAQSIVAYLHAFIQHEVNEKRESPFGDALRFAAAQAARDTGRPRDLTPLLRESPAFDARLLSELVASTESPIRGGDPFRFDPSLLRLTLSGLSPLSGDLGVDDGDKLGVLSLEAAVACGARTIGHRMEVRVKILAPRLPVVSKFTLCVFGLPPGKDGECYNTVLVSRQGDVLAGSPCQPLILDHATAAGDLMRGGWVYLGARDKAEILLNKAAGYERMGEMFQFYDRDAGDPEPARMTARTDPRPDPDLRGLFPEGERFLAIVNNYWGFHDGMNAQDVFARHFAVGDPVGGSCSSYFRLYGTKAEPSRTRVIGNVLQRAPYYAVLATLNPTSGAGEYPIAMLRSVDEEEFADALLDAFVYTDATGAQVPGSALLGWAAGEFRADRFFCGKPAVYAWFMSDYWSFPYNFNYEFMNRRPGGFDPNAPLEPVHFLDRRYIVHADEFRLQDASGRPLFSGNLTDFSSAGAGILARAAERKCVARFANPEEFFRHCLAADGTLAVPGAAFIERGPMRVERPLAVRAGGLVAVARGDIEVAAAVRNPSSDPLTFAALAGDLALSTPEPVEAALVALRGSGAGATGGEFRASAPMRVKGAVVCDVFDPEEAPAGGRLAYDPRLDPFGDHPARLFLEDRDLRFADLEPSGGGGGRP